MHHFLKIKIPLIDKKRCFFRIDSLQQICKRTIALKAKKKLQIMHAHAV